MSNKTDRVKYNFELKFPTTEPFSFKDVMTANPGVQYITLNKRLNKLIADGVVESAGVLTNPEKRGRSVKLYQHIIVTKAKKVKAAKV